jgi:hypothetical protein
MINIHFNNYPFLAYYLNNFNQNYNFNYFGAMVTRLTTFVFLYHCIRVSPWGWPECWPKHVGENFMNKIQRRYWSAFDGYLYILDHSNAWKVVHITWNICSAIFSWHFQYQISITVWRWNMNTTHLLCVHFTHCITNA